MLGRLPWFAFERRIRALRFLVFFDMRSHSSGLKVDVDVTTANRVAMLRRRLTPVGATSHDYPSMGFRLHPSLNRHRRAN
jgi:hypothetical protein